jgi:NDP-sugar pyrophosphorylase family protein
MINIVIPMAGLGSRFIESGIKTPKPLIEIDGQTLIEHSVKSLGIEGKFIFITRQYENTKYNKDLSKILKKIAPECIEIRLDKNQLGAADAVLYAKKYIDNNQELIITNCDQKLDWDGKKFIDFVHDRKCDGSVVLFKSLDSKNSFAKLSGERVIELAEKKVISDNALFGLHYWKNGKDFVNSAEKLRKEYKQKKLTECYVSETYNYLVEKQKILGYFIDLNQFHLLGTPEDLEIYSAKIKEYYTDKPKTIFCDIDGTIIKHVHGFSYVGKSPSEALQGAIDKFNEWDSKGHRVILTTARKESARYITEKQLSELGFCWDLLIMGVTSGERVLINDKLREQDDDRAIAVNVITDKNFLDIDWKSLGL